MINPAPVPCSQTADTNQPQTVLAALMALDDALDGQLTLRLKGCLEGLYCCIDEDRLADACVHANRIPGLIPVYTPDIVVALSNLQALLDAYKGSQAQR